MQKSKRKNHLIDLGDFYFLAISFGCMQKKV